MKKDKRRHRASEGVRTKHTPACKQNQRRYRLAMKVYVKKFPDWCWTCRGSGYVHWTENGAPHGEGYWAMPMTDVCEHCTGKGICPRCAKFVREDWADKETPCPHCGWNWGKGKNDLPPPELECDCWSLQYSKTEEEEYA